MTCITDKEVVIISDIACSEVIEMGETYENIITRPTPAVPGFRKNRKNTTMKGKELSFDDHFFFERGFAAQTARHRWDEWLGP
jgi:hypothetical protein